MKDEPTLVTLNIVTNVGMAKDGHVRSHVNLVNMGFNVKQEGAHWNVSDNVECH